MKVLFIGGIFDDTHDEEIVKKTRTYVEYAANNFQKKLINGFKECGVDINVISAPFLGAYPKAYADWYFKGFSSMESDYSGYEYVKFINIWGIRNISRANAVKKAVHAFIKVKEQKKLIIVYTPHTPFIQAANYVKKRDKNIKICIVVPDLPQYMNLADNVSSIYAFLKKYDVKSFLRESKKADSFMVLTYPMINKLNVGKRPFCVVEGIYQNRNKVVKTKGNDEINKIVYAGKLNRSFGVINLVKAFSNIKDNKIRLIICGSGEEEKAVKKYAETDKRIDYKGQVSSKEAEQIVIDGDILVNPRPNNSEYTKYSFPSKIIDYLSTGNPVVAYKLDGMPEVYKDFIYCVPDNTIFGLQKTIEYVLYSATDNEKKVKSEKALQYFQQEISEKMVAKKILKMNSFD